MVRLLVSLQAVDAREEVTALLRRDPAAHAALDDTDDVARLLDTLWQAGAHEQVTALVRRDPAAHAVLENPYLVGRLLHSLQAADAREQVTALADRAVGHVALKALEEQRNGEWRYLKFLQVTSLARGRHIHV